MVNNTPTTIFEALLFLWSRAAEGKDRRSLTDDEREVLDERDPGGSTSYYSFGVEIHDVDGTPYVWGAWSHAMTWQFFQGRQAGIGLLVSEYARQEYSEFVGLNEKLQGVLKYLDSLQLHLPVFWHHVLDRYPSLADEWSASKFSRQRQPGKAKLSLGILDAREQADRRKLAALPPIVGIDVRSALTAEAVVATEMRRAGGAGAESKPGQHIERQLPVPSSGPSLRLDDLSDTEQNIIEALSRATMTGEKLAKAAGYPFNSNFKGTLSSLRKRGILGNMAPGYVLNREYHYLLAADKGQDKGQD